MKAKILAALCVAMVAVCAGADVVITPPSGGGGGDVLSVFGRTGAVTAEQADYDSFFLTPAEADALYLSLGGGTLTGAVTERRNGIGSTSTDGVILDNTTAAAAGAQQWSPRFRLTGRGWKTNATAASQTVDWTVENVPVQGAANPSSRLTFNYQVNGGGYVNGFTMTPANVLGAENVASGNAEFGVLNSGNLRTGVKMTGDGIFIRQNSSDQVQFVNGSGPRLHNARLLQWSSAADVTSASDTFVGRRAAATIQLGAADAATPVAQILTAQGARSGTDTDTAAPEMTIRAPLGTGTGTPSALVIQAPNKTATGTTQQTAVTRATIGDSGTALVGNVTVGRGTENLSGTVATNGTTTLQGTGTQFLQELNVGDTINIAGETSRVVSTITDLDTLVLTVAASTTASGLTYASTAITPTVIGANGRVLAVDGTFAKPGLAFLSSDDGSASGFTMSSGALVGVSNGVGIFSISGLDLIAFGTTNAINGFVTALVNRTSDGSETSSSNQYIITNSGAASLVTRTLATAVSTGGQNHQVFCEDTDGLKIAVATGDQFRVGGYTTATAGYLQSTVMGSTFEAATIDATTWQVSRMTGVWTDGSYTWVDGVMSSGPALASAATLPAAIARVQHVTGTTTVTAMTSTGIPAGWVSTLIFDGVLTFTDGGNMVLAGDFVTTANDSITVVFDGTNFIEMSRSVN